ncbi:hypothetical protein CP8484711_0470A, partial [Chlamydia psittaci 84-8471/1]
MIYDYV